MHDLRGKVKSFTEFSFTAIDSMGVLIQGEPVSTNALYENYSIVFDANGNLISEVMYNLDHEISRRVVYDYSLFYNREPIYSIYDSSGHLTERWEAVEYDSYNNVTEALIQNSLGQQQIEHHEYTYGDNGVLVSERRTVDGVLTSITTTTKDKANRLSRQELSLYTSDSRYVGGTLFVRDTLRNIESTYYLDSDSTINSYTISELSTAGSPLRNRHFNSNEQLKQFDAFVYNELGDLTERVHSFYSENQEHTITYTYTYEYDSFNNWTSRTEFADGSPKYIARREYIYF